LATALASRFARNGEAPDDVRQASLLGLLHAIDRFDPGRGVKFSTFAWVTIMGELKRHFRDRTWAVRVPRALQERYLVALEAVDGLTVELGHSPTIAQVATRTGMTEEDVLEAMEVKGAYRMTSLDAPVPEDPAGIQIADETDDLSRVEDRRVLSPLLGRLPARDRDIVRLRFMDELSQSEIARRVGLSQMHVSRRLARSLALLREWAQHS
jgi:RNA polymerase sigma-B factor